MMKYEIGLFIVFSRPLKSIIRINYQVFKLIITLFYLQEILVYHVGYLFFIFTPLFNGVIPRGKLVKTLYILIVS